MYCLALLLVMPSVIPFETKLVNNPELVEWDGKTFAGSLHHGSQTGSIY